MSHEPVLHDDAGVGPDRTLALLVAELESIERRILAVENEHQGAIARVDPLWTDSARNLVHYVALRQIDLRELQFLLQQRGLSSLGRSESFVLASLREVLARAREALHAHEPRAITEPALGTKPRDGALPWQAAKYLLHEHTRAALGPRPQGRHIYILVTAPSAEEANATWCARMLREGMNLLRINCAHEDSGAWQRMLDALEVAKAETGLDCRVLMDLAGPKIRTGPIEATRAVVTWKVERDATGNVVAPTRVELVAESRKDEPRKGPGVLLADTDLARLAPDDVLRFRDARGRKRKLRVVRDGERLVVEATRRAWVVAGTKATLRRASGKASKVSLLLGPAPSDDPAIELATDDRLIITKTPSLGRAASRDEDDRVLAPARIACTLPVALSGVAVGHRVLFDDGKFEGVVEAARGDELTVRIRRAPPGGAKLRAEKGINLPDSVVPVKSLTEDDRRDLAFVVEHADLVALSFVRTASDVVDLHKELDALGRGSIGVVLKIETKTGFENLPRILLEGMRRAPLAVMIARGDLAVEIGFERLAEVQEEILWLCEASHVPAIWATQVLDTLARTGVPSRAEITDAAASVGAECVMLNKGQYVALALRTLIDILHRMEGHRYKKRDIFRRLKVSSMD